MPEWLLEVFKYVFLIAAGGGGMKFWDYLANRSRTAAETKEITARADISTLELSDKMVRDWMVTAAAATKQVNDSTRQVARLENHIDDLVQILRRGLKMMEEARVPGLEDFKKELNMAIEARNTLHETDRQN